MSKKDNTEVRNLNISFFIPWITQGRGGTENVGSMMVNSMVERGHNVRIYTFDDKNRSPTWPLHDDVDVRCHPEKITQNSAGQILMELAIQEPDLIVGLHMNREFLRYVYFGNRLEIPVLLSEHIDPRAPQEIGTFTQTERVAIFSGADRIHLLIDEFRNTLPDFLQKRICVVPNTVVPARRLADPRGAMNRKSVILAVARLVPRKNLANLIKAFAFAHVDQPGWVLKIVGYGSQRNFLEKLAENLGVMDSVEFVGRMEDAYPAYEEAQIFVLPSITEGFPMTSLEAMAHSLPLLGYAKCPGINIQIRHGKNGLLAEGGRDVGSLDVELARMMSDPDLRVKLGEESYKIYQKEYSPQVIAEKWEKMFLDAAHADLSEKAVELTDKEYAALNLKRMTDTGMKEYSEYQNCLV